MKIANESEPTSQPATIGIVAGWGNYPISVARALREQGHRIVVAGIVGHADAELSNLADAFHWFGVAKLGAQQRFFKQHGVSHVVLAGKLFKDKLLFHGRGWLGLMPDRECIRTFYWSVIRGRTSQNDDALLSAVVQSFHRQGMEVVAGTHYAPTLLAEEGVLTSIQPTAAIVRDIHFGWAIAKEMGGLDIGQSITIRDRTVLAVEAIEGTDACIARTGSLCPRGGFTLIKVAKPQQDRRFDQPTIGVGTIEQMIRAKGKAIAIEAGETIVVDRERVLALANKHGIAIVSYHQEKVKVIAA